MMNILFFVLELQCQGLSVNVMLNDIVMFSDPHCTDKTTQVNVNPWIIKGDNHLQVQLGLPIEVKTSHNNRASQMFELRLASGVRGKEPGPEDRRAEYILNTTDKNFKINELKTVWQKNFEVSPAFGRWAWQDAIPYSEAEHQAVMSLLNQIHSALSNKNSKKLRSILDLKNKEMSRSMGVDSAMMLSGQDSFFTSYFNNPDWKIEPLDPSKLRFIPEASGRLIKVTDLNGNPPLRGAAGERPFLMEIIVSNINGTWHIIR